MQDEWDKKQIEILQQQRLSQQMDLEQKQFEMGKRDQQMQEDDFYYNRGLKEAEQKLQAQTRSEATAIIGGLNQLDPQSLDYQKNVAILFGRNPLGAADERVQKVASQYGQAHEKYAAGRAALQSDDESTRKELGEVAKISELSGLPMSNFVTTDPTTGRDVINYEALGRAEAVVSQKDPKEPVFGGKTQEELESIISGINANIAEAAAGENIYQVEGLEAKKRYYEGLLPKDDKDVATAAKGQYIPVDDREAGKVYPTPKGDMKWTGSGWTEP
jgi:hypothetical protein